MLHVDGVVEPVGDVEDEEEGGVDGEGVLVKLLLELFPLVRKVLLHVVGRLGTVLGLESRKNNAFRDL